MDHERTTGGTRWAVRGIPVELQREVAEAADLVGMKLGRWVERALRDALARQRAALQEDMEYGAGEPDETPEHRQQRRERALRLASTSTSVGELDLEALADAVASRLVARSTASSPKAISPAESARNTRRMSADDKREILAALKAGKESRRQIAQRFGYSHQRISQMAKEMGRE